MGSGKTMVAAQAAVIALENDFQVAVLAPTEILAAQHYRYFRNLLEKLGYPVALLTGSGTAREKAQIKRLMAAGHVKVVVGTHALLQDDVEFSNLGLAIVDEQHRFGVRQRWEMFRKGREEQVDALVMTATPIPRTLALTIYGDLDVSIIDELPPGRKPIRTKHVTEAGVEGVYGFVAQEIAAGRQAYVVYPIVEETEATAAKAAEQMHQHLSTEVFPNVPIGLLHGRLSTDEKEAAMRNFQTGDTKILVATTVIEVGVDVRECLCDGDRTGGTLWLGAVASVTRPGWTRSLPELLHPGHRQAQRGCGRTDSHDGRFDRWLLHRRDGYEAERSGRVLWDQTSRCPRSASRRLAPGRRCSRPGPAARLAICSKSGANQDELRAVARYIQENWQRRYGLIQVG